MGLDQGVFLNDSVCENSTVKMAHGDEDGVAMQELSSMIIIAVMMGFFMS